MEQPFADSAAQSRTAEQRLHVAAFGKHPAWNDHIDDVGLETDALVAVKRQIYQGIAVNIDSGAWEKLPAASRLAGYDHLFLGRAEGDLFAGRMWSSRDGKGRSRYPMILCAHCRELPLRWVLEQVLPCLETLKDRCVAATEQGQVIRALADARRQLRRAAAALAPARSPLELSPRLLVEMADRPELGPERRGLQRVLYQIDRELPAFRAGEAPPAEAPTTPHHMRVPLGEADGAELGRWLCFMASRLDPRVPIFVLARLGHRHADVLVGPATGRELYCVQAAPEAVPTTAEIPYSIDEAFVEEVEEQIEQSRQGKLTLPDDRMGHKAGGGLLRFAWPRWLRKA